MNFNKLIKSTYPYILAIILLYFVWKIFSGNNISQVFNHITLELIAVSFIFYTLLIKPINTLRYSYFFKIEKINQLYWIMNFSNLMVNFLPFRSGELTYIHYLKKLGIERSKSISGLLTIRFFDYVVLALLFAISLISMGTIFISHEEIIVWSIISLPLIVLLGLFLVYKLAKKNGKINRIMLAGLTEIRSYKLNKLSSLLGLSLLYWSIRLLFGYVLLLMLGINLNFLTVVFISTLLILVGLIPIQVFSNFGVFEFGWVYLLSNLSINIDKNILFNKILAFHLAPLIPVIIMGILGYIFLRIFNSK